MTTQLELHSLLNYDQITGTFRWAVQRWRRKVGDLAGSIDSHGYVQISVKGRLFLAHRLVFLHVHGKLPDGLIDHINGDRMDNRLANLRPAMPEINAQNLRKAPKSNMSSGLLGVTRVTGKTPGKWQARITANGKQRYLGVFESPDIAHAAYLSAKREAHAGCTI